MLSSDRQHDKLNLPSSPLSLASSFLSSRFSRTWENLPPNKNCGKEVCRSSTYCSCECEWAASSFFGGAHFKFLRKENRKLLQVAPVIHAWQEGVWSPSNNLSLADFLVTDKPFPSVFSSVKYWSCVQKFFFQRWFFYMKIKLFSLKKSILRNDCHVTIYLQIHLVCTPCCSHHIRPMMRGIHSTLNSSVHHLHGQLGTYP